MKPFYEHNGIVIYNADCRDVLPAIGPGTADLIFADPPFNLDKKYGAVRDKRVNYYEWCAEWINASFDALKESGTIYLKTIARHLEKTFPMMGARGVFISQVIWENVAAAHDKRRYWNAYEPILVYGKSADYYFDTYAEEDRTSFVLWSRSRNGRKRRQLKDMWLDIPLVYAGSVVHPEAILKRGTRQKANPCQMPMRLSARALRFSCPEGGLVIEPFMGSGTTLDVAQRLGVRAIGCDIEEGQCEVAAKRLEKNMLNFESVA